MGTRGGYGFSKDRQLKVTYNHYDSYPDVLGESIVGFIKNTSYEDMLKAYDNIELINEWEIPNEEQIQHCKDAGTVDLGVSFGREDDWYCLLRKAQGDLSFYTLKGLKYMTNSEKFLENDTFCEYYYIISLDDKTLRFGTNYGDYDFIITFEEIMQNEISKTVELMNQWSHNV
jgi:hypothetical protein